MDPADKHARGVHTPDARYPHTGTGRDIIRVVGARPVLDKSAGESTILPGDTVTYNVDLALESLASGDSTADLVLTDTLPAGASYVANSTQFSPSIGAGEPAISGQTLTWTVPPGVPFNQSYTLTYDVVFDGDPQTELVGGKQLKNTIEADYLSLEDSSSATVAVNEAGLTSIIKSAGSDLIPRQGPDALTNEWTIKVISEDPSVSAFTDTIDVLPYDGDNRGTSFNGSYTISPVQAAGATVYYTSEDPSTLSDDPAHPSNGAPNAPSGIWSTSYSPDATAVRVIGGTLLPSATFEYSIPFEVEDFEYGDTLGNRAQGIAENTRLVMRTSAETTLAPDVSAELQKYVLDRGGDPNNEADWIKGDHVEEAPRYAIGEQVWYRIVVTNTGDLPLTDIDITDDLFPQGNTTIAGPLAPGATAEHVFEVTLEADTSTITDGSYPGTCEVDGWDESMTDTVVNHAWASAKDSDDNDVEIPCDPTIIKNPGEPTHDKQLVDAAPIGDGQWEVTYRITVENTSDRDATYDLHDELRFADEVTVISAQISDSPSQVTLYDPAWDGQANQVIAANAKLLANDHANYAPHVYDITVIAEIPLFIDTSGEVDPTECADPSGEPTSTALTNTSTLTKPDDDTEEDWACAPIPSLDISKSLTDGPTLGTDGEWEVTYEIVVTNNGSVEHTYDLHDQLRYGGALEVLTADVDGPSGVDVNSGWTGLGADLDAPENLIADGVDLGADETHTFTVTVTAEIDDAQADLSTVECPPPGSAENGGFANSAQLGANDQAAVDEDCASIELEGEVIWNKVDVNDSFLAGSEWMLEGPEGAEIPVTDCVADTPADCAAEVDVDHRPGQFRVTGLAWGEWTLVETTAPAGFLLDDTEHPFELTLVNNQVSVDLGDMINEQRPPTTLPLTGGVSQLAVLLTGTGILALTSGLGVAHHLRRRR